MHPHTLPPMRTMPLLLAAALALTGCASAPNDAGSNVVLIVQSDPPGATISHTLTGLSAAAPARFYYDPTWFGRMQDAQGCVTAPGYRARWPDGTQAASERVRMCGSADSRYTVTIRSAAAAAVAAAAAPAPTRAERPQLEGADLAVEVMRAVTPAAVILMDRPRTFVPQAPAVTCSSYQLGTVTRTTCR